MRDTIEKLFDANDLDNLKRYNHYDLLGVNRYAAGDEFTRDVIKQYRQLALRFHPDLYQGDKTKAEIFKLINEAYSTLNDGLQRRTYDEKLNEEVNNPARTAASFFHASQQEKPPLPTEIYCFFYTQMNAWQAFGWEADITVVNKTLNDHFILSGHILPVKCLIFSGNGRYLASADMDNILKIWDLSTRECLQTFTANTRRISHLFFSKNSEWLISGEEDQLFFSSTRKIEAWDFKNGKNLGVFSGFYSLSKSHYGDDQCFGSGVTHLAISPEGGVVPGSGDKIVTTQCENEIIVPIWPDYVAKPISMHGYEFNASKSHVLVREKLAISLWNLKTKTRVVSVKTTPTKAQADKDCRIACAFNPVNKTFAYGVAEVCIVDYHGRVQKKLSNRDVIDNLMYTPNGKFLISQGRNSVVVHDCETEKSYCLSIEPGFDGINISADSQKMLVIPHSYSNCMVAVFEIATGKRLLEKELQYDGVKNSGFMRIGADVSIVRHAFSKNCQTIALGLTDKSIRLVDANTFEMTILRSHRDWVIGVAFSPDNQWLVTTSRDNTICVWDYKERVLKEQINSGYSEHIIFVDDHRFLFDAGKQIKMWDIATRKMDDVCRISFREKLHYADGALFFEDEKCRLTKIDISSVLNGLENQVALASTVENVAEDDVDDSQQFPVSVAKEENMGCGCAMM